MEQDFGGCVRGFGFLLRVGSRLLNHVAVSIGQALKVEKIFIAIDGGWVRFPAIMYGGLINSVVKGRYEYDERILVKRLIAPSDSILEIGGAVGVLARAYSSISPKKHVVVEANPNLIPFLRSNLKGREVEIVNSLASWKEGVEEFHVAKNFYSSSVNPSEGSEKVMLKTVNVNTLAEDYGSNVLIMDIEGFEYTLVPKMDLSRFRLAIVELHETSNTQDVQRLLSYFGKCGFNFMIRSWRGNVLVFNKD